MKICHCYPLKWYTSDSRFKVYFDKHVLVFLNRVHNLKLSHTIKYVVLQYCRQTHLNRTFRQQIQSCGLSGNAVGEWSSDCQWLNELRIVYTCDSWYTDESAFNPVVSIKIIFENFGCPDLVLISGIDWSNTSKKWISDLINLHLIPLMQAVYPRCCKVSKKKTRLAQVNTFKL